MKLQSSKASNRICRRIAYDFMEKEHFNDI